MTGAGIFDGDIIVVDRPLAPSDRKIIVVASTASSPSSGLATKALR
jgi:SOS-response transcriptional repressor LexA